ncbi:MAG TPA: glycosyltransferase [Planctomycetota bacterium]|nr:glycosyltransferase [Planctomycetota bacterium]
MNILFVAYGDFHCNSSIHVFGFANQLARMGHACAVAVPQKKESVASLGEPLFRAFTFDEIKSGARIFENANAPDIIHCWTPREVVRAFAEPLREKWRCKLAIHLEDNEERLIEEFFKTPIAELRKLAPPELDKRMRSDLSHPLRFPKFLQSADGATVIMDRLKEFLPYNKPVEIIWPGIDFDLFKAKSPHSREADFPAIQPGDKVLAYTGHVHWANRDEVRTLYLAVGALNDRGIATKLLRTGDDFYPFLSPNEEWVRQYEIKLGRVEWTVLPQVLNAADVLVQPGRDDAFNAYRLPSKLPEFMAMGKPVIMPRTNLGRFVTEGECAILPKTGSVQELAACIDVLFKSPELCAHLGSNARKFAQRHFNWENSGKWLERFYKRILGKEGLNDDYNPIASLHGSDEPVLPEEQAACEQMMQLNAVRWPAIMAALELSETRLAKMSYEGTAAKIDVETRLFEARKTKGWRLMRLLRRMHAMLWKRTDGGWLGFLKWIFSRSKVGKNFDPFEGAQIHCADFDRSAKKK